MRLQIICFLLFCATTTPGFAWRSNVMRGPNVKFGYEFDHHRKYQPNIGFAYDYALATCTKKRLYRAIGINYSPSNDFLDLGIQIKINPFHYYSALPLTRSFTIHYYLHGSANYRKVYGLEDAFNYRAGIGTYWNYRFSRWFQITPEINAAYLFTPKELGDSNRFIFDFKLSFFVHWRSIRKHKEWKKKKEAEETD